MATTNYDYDTAAIRREARQLEKCMYAIGDIAIPGVKRAEGRTDENLSGETAKAMMNSLQVLHEQLSREYNALRQLSSKLFAYADGLEEADRRAAELMKK